MPFGMLCFRSGPENGTIVYLPSFVYDALAWTAVGVLLTVVVRRRRPVARRVLEA